MPVTPVGTCSGQGPTTTGPSATTTAVVALATIQGTETAAVGGHLAATTTARTAVADCYAPQAATTVSTAITAGTRAVRAMPTRTWASPAAVSTAPSVEKATAQQGPATTASAFQAAATGAALAAAAPTLTPADGTHERRPASI